MIYFDYNGIRRSSRDGGGCMLTIDDPLKSEVFARIYSNYVGHNLSEKGL